MRPTPGKAPIEISSGWDDFVEDLLTQPTTTRIDHEALAYVREILQRLAVGLPGSDDSDLEQLRGLMLAAPDIAAAVEAALTPVVLHEPRLILRLRDSLLPPVYGTPVGDLLRTIIMTGS